jgi:quinol monooxygenase YgiN
MPEVVLPAFLLTVAGLHRLSLLSTTTQPQEEFMKPATQINFFSIKPGKIDEFIEAERSYAASTNLPPGLIGSRMYRSLDGKSVVRVSKYESIEAHKEVHQDEALRQHIDRLSPLFESSSSALYEEVYTTGDLN